MFQFPPITIQICTYRRPQEIEATITAIRQHLVYPNYKLLVSDDSSGSEYADHILGLSCCQGVSVSVISTATNGGWGANVNNGLRHTETEFVFFVEDDYVLTAPLDLRIGVALLFAKPDVGYVRYRGCAGEAVILHQFEADITAYLPSYREGVGLPGKLNYLQFDSGSPALYLYSHGPHLKRLSFHKFYGLYQQAGRLGEIEEAYAHTVKDGMKRPGAPALAILPEWMAMKWDHIGKSYQGSVYDVSR